MTELGRRAVHVSGAAVPLSSLLGVPWWIVRWFVLAGATTALVLEALRLSHVVEWTVFERLTREYEWRSVAGYAWYAIGFAVAAWAFDQSIAVAAMLMLAIGDPLSGLLSTGERSVKRGPVLLATFGVCVGIASLLGIGVRASVAGALVATVADGVTLKVGSRYIDDNVVIPVGAGLAMTAVATL